MELTNEELEGLIAYFDETNINITKLIQKIGLKKVKLFEKGVDKLYKLNETK